MKCFLFCALLTMNAAAFAQQSAIELLRQDLKTQKVAIVTASLILPKEQADRFWPIYREYDVEMSKLGDRRLAVLKEFAEAYESIDEKRAERLVKESFSIADDRNKLLQKYYKRISKTVGVLTAARFVQVENQIQTLLDAQIIERIPLVKTGAASEGKQ